MIKEFDWAHHLFVWKEMFLIYDFWFKFPNSFCFCHICEIKKEIRHGLM